MSGPTVTVGTLPESRITSLTADLAARAMRSRLPVNVMDYTGVDNTGATSSTAAFVAAESDAFILGRELYAPAGTYLLSAQFNHRMWFGGDGKGKTVLTRNGDFGFTRASGSKASAISLSANATANATTFTFTDAAAISSISAGDWLIARSTVAWPNGSTGTKVGETVRVLSKATNVLTLEGPINETYATADSSVVEKYNFLVGVGLSNMTLQGTTASGTSGGATFDYCRAPCVRDVEFKNLDGPGVTMNSCVDWTVENTDLLDLTDDLANSRVGYGVNCNGPSRDGLMFNCKVHNVRHGFTTNGSAEGVPHNNVVAFCRASGSSAAMWDTHEEGRFTYFVNCEVHNTASTAFKARAPDTWIINPMVSGVSAVAVTSTALRTRVQGGRISTIGVGGIRFQAGGDDGSVQGTDLLGTASEGIRADSGVNRMIVQGAKIKNFSTGVYAAGSSSGHYWKGCFVDNASNVFKVDSGSTATVRDEDAVNSTTLLAGAGTYLNRATATWDPASVPAQTLVGTATWDPPSVASGAFASTTVPVTGAAIGDAVAAGFTPAVPAGVLVTGQVTAADTVTVTLYNVSGGSVDLASGTLTARVHKTSVPSTSTTVTVTGAAVGDPVDVGFSPAVPAGVAIEGQVTATNTVTVSLLNLSGSTQDLASGTLTINVKNQ